MANRHGLITGATGTGKTVTLQKLAESLSEIGVPVFMADVKGDLTGIAQAGTASEKLLARLKNIGVNDWQPHADPVVVWDIFGEKGHPVRATVSDLSVAGAAVDLNDVQSGVLNIIFRIADDQGLLLLTLKSGRLPSTSAITPNLSRISTVISVAHRLVPSSADCCRWNSKAQHTSLASRCWISKLDAHRYQR